MASSIGFRIFSFLPSCYSSYGAWTFTPVGLAPTDHASLRWTHTFGERLADLVARFGGSWSFIILFAIVLVVYSSTNVALHNRAWDPYPFILLNLFLSMLAAIQAPVIMMSQNRQDMKDRVRS